MPAAVCPSCQGMIELEPEVQIGRPITCPHCSESLEVVWLYPIEVDLTEEKTSKNVQDGDLQNL